MRSPSFRALERIEVTQYVRSFIRTLSGVYRVTADVNMFRQHRTHRRVTGTGMRNRVHLNWMENLLACSTNLGYPHRTGEPSVPSTLLSIVKAETLVGFPVLGARSKIAKTRQCWVPIKWGGGLETVCELMPNQSECRIASRPTQAPLPLLFRDVPFRPSASSLFPARCTCHQLVIPFRGTVSLPFLPLFFIPTIDYSFISYCFIGWCLFILLSFICGNAVNERIKKRMFRHTVY